MTVGDELASVGGFLQVCGISTSRDWDACFCLDIEVVIIQAWWDGGTLISAFDQILGCVASRNYSALFCNLVEIFTVFAYRDRFAGVGLFL